MAKILELEGLQKYEAYLKSTVSIFVSLIAQKISHIRHYLMHNLGLRVKNTYTEKKDYWAGKKY